MCERMSPSSSTSTVPDPSASWLTKFARIRLASATDKSNLRKIQQGSFGDGKTLEQLLEHPHAKTAKLKLHHVLALRIYTSSSYSKINDPLRKTPPQVSLPLDPWWTLSSRN